MVYLLSEVDGVATDSGGLQEEASSLKKATFILRNETDRLEAVAQKAALLVGTHPKAIEKTLSDWMEGKCDIHPSPSIYGDGHAAEKIANSLKEIISEQGENKS